MEGVSLKIDNNVQCTCICCKVAFDPEKFRLYVAIKRRFEVGFVIAFLVFIS